MSSKSKKSVLVAAALSAIGGTYAKVQAAAPIYGSPAYVGGSGGTGGFTANGTAPVPKTNATNPGTSVITGASVAAGYINYPSSTGGTPVADNNDLAAYIISSSGTTVRLASPGSNPTAPSGSTATSPLPGAVIAFGINGAANLVVGNAPVGYTAANSYTTTAATEWNATTGAVSTFATQNADTSTFTTVNSSGAYRESAAAVNASGLTAGGAYIYTPGTTTFVSNVPVLWTSTSSAPVLLPNAGLSSSGSYSGTAYAINGSGTVVGELTSYSSGSSTGNNAVAWTLGATTPTLLPSAATAAGNNPNDFARVVNDSGVIAGYTNPASGQSAARWFPSGSGYTLQPLNTVGSSTGSGTAGGGGDITAINTAGDVVGSAIVYSVGATTGPTGTAIAANTIIGTRPLLWLAGSMTPIQLQVDGTSTTGSSDYYAGAHSGGNFTAAVFGVNAADYSVGNAVKYNSSGTEVLTSTATLWDGSGALTELNSLIGITTPTNSGPGSLASGVSGWTNLIQADGITDTGWISGYGEYYDAVGADSYQRAFLLYDSAAAVPEPATLATTAIIGTFALARRRRTRNAK